MPTLHLSTLQAEVTSNTLTLLAALGKGSPITFLYRDSDGIVSVRWAIPRSIRRCDNGETIVLAHDLARRAPRAFNIERITLVSAGLREYTVSA